MVVRNWKQLGGDGHRNSLLFRSTKSSITLALNLSSAEKKPLIVWAWIMLRAALNGSST